MKKPKLPTVVCVEWLDACVVSGADTVTDADLESAADCVTLTVGFLLKRDKRGIWISPWWYPTEQVASDRSCEPFFVPAGMVRRVTKLS